MKSNATLSMIKYVRSPLSNSATQFRTPNALSHTLPSARLSMSKSAPLSLILSMSRIVPAMESKSAALSMNKSALLITSSNATL